MNRRERFSRAVPNLTAAYVTRFVALQVTRLHSEVQWSRGRFLARSEIQLCIYKFIRLVDSPMPFSYPPDCPSMSRLASPFHFR